jgi:hypothetical protein
MEAGMSALTAIEAPAENQQEGAEPGPAHAGRWLRLVGQVAGPEQSRDEVAILAAPQPRSSSIGEGPDPRQAGAVLIPSAVIAPRSIRARPHVSSPPPLRLTRRGRAVVATLVVAVMAAIALGVGLAAAGGVQAANHGRPTAGYQGMHEIVVRPGQTLWSIASAAEPGADPRDVVQEIMTANAMSDTTISAGQLLWVPR